MSTIECPGNAPGNVCTPSEELFEPSRLRLSQSFDAAVGVRRLLKTIPVRRPDLQTYLQVHPDSAYRLNTAILEIKEERENYLVDPGVRPEIATELIPKALFTAITRQGVLFLWPIRLPDSDGRLDTWNRSALDAAEEAMKGRWVRVAANRNLGAYEVWVAEAELPGPEWPQLSFSEILQIAFRDRYVQTLDHPVVRRLRGQV